MLEYIGRLTEGAIGALDMRPGAGPVVYIAALPAHVVVDSSAPLILVPRIEGLGITTEVTAQVMFEGDTSVLVVQPPPVLTFTLKPGETSLPFEIALRPQSVGGEFQILKIVLANTTLPISGRNPRNLVIRSTPGTNPVVALDDEFFVTIGEIAELDVLQNDSPKTGMLIESVGVPVRGTVTISTDKKKLLYTPGVILIDDSFSYTVRHVSGNTATASILVHIAGEFRLVDDAFTIEVNADTSLDVLVNDVGIGLRIINVTPVSDGVISVAPSGLSLLYIAPSEPAIVAGIYTVQNSAGQQLEASFTIDVESVVEPVDPRRQPKFVSFDLGQRHYVGGVVVPGARNYPGTRTGLANAMAAVVPGDIVIISDGTYSGASITTAVAGTMNDRIYVAGRTHIGAIIALKIIVDSPWWWFTSIEFTYVRAKPTARASWHDVDAAIVITKHGTSVTNCRFKSPCSIYMDNVPPASPHDTTILGNLFDSDVPVDWNTAPAICMHHVFANAFPDNIIIKENQFFCAKNGTLSGDQDSRPILLIDAQPPSGNAIAVNKSFDFVRNYASGHFGERVLEVFRHIECSYNYLELLSGTGTLMFRHGILNGSVFEAGGMIEGNKFVGGIGIEINGTGAFLRGNRGAGAVGAAPLATPSGWPYPQSGIYKKLNFNGALKRYMESATIEGSDQFPVSEDDDGRLLFVGADGEGWTNVTKTEWRVTRVTGTPPNGLVGVDLAMRMDEQANDPGTLPTNSKPQGILAFGTSNVAVWYTYLANLDDNLYDGFRKRVFVATSTNDGTAYNLNRGSSDWIFNCDTATTSDPLNVWGVLQLGAGYASAAGIDNDYIYVYLSNAVQVGTGDWNGAHLSKNIWLARVKWKGTSGALSNLTDRIKYEMFTGLVSGAPTWGTAGALTPRSVVFSDGNGMALYLNVYWHANINKFVATYIHCSKPASGLPTQGIAVAISDSPWDVNGWEMIGYGQDLDNHASDEINMYMSVMAPSRWNNGSTMHFAVSTYVDPGGGGSGDNMIVTPVTLELQTPVSDVGGLTIRTGAVETGGADVFDAGSYLTSVDDQLPYFRIGKLDTGFSLNNPRGGAPHHIRIFRGVQAAPTIILDPTGDPGDYSVTTGFDEYDPIVPVTAALINETGPEAQGTIINPPDDDPGEPSDEWPPATAAILHASTRTQLLDALTKVAPGGHIVMAGTKASPINYTGNYTCNKIGTEAKRIIIRAEAVGGAIFNGVFSLSGEYIALHGAYANGVNANFNISGKNNTLVRCGFTSPARDESGSQSSISGPGHSFLFCEGFDSATRVFRMDVEGGLLDPTIFACCFRDSAGGTAIGIGETDGTNNRWSNTNVNGLVEECLFSNWVGSEANEAISNKSSGNTWKSLKFVDSDQLSIRHGKNCKVISCSLSSGRNYVIKGSGHLIGGCSASSGSQFHLDAGNHYQEDGPWPGEPNRAAARNCIVEYCNGPLRVGEVPSLGGHPVKPSLDNQIKRHTGTITTQTDYSFSNPDPSLEEDNTTNPSAPAANPHPAIKNLVRGGTTALGTGWTAKWRKPPRGYGSKDWSTPGGPDWVLEYALVNGTVEDWLPLWGGVGPAGISKAAVAADGLLFKGGIRTPDDDPAQQLMAWNANTLPEGDWRVEFQYKRTSTNATDNGIATQFWVGMGNGVFPTDPREEDGVVVEKPRLADLIEGINGLRLTFNTVTGVVEQNNELRYHRLLDNVDTTVKESYPQSFPFTTGTWYDMRFQKFEGNFTVTVTPVGGAEQNFVVPEVPGGIYWALFVQEVRSFNLRNVKVYRRGNLASTPIRRVPKGNHFITTLQYTLTGPLAAFAAIDDLMYVGAYYNDFVKGSIRYATGPLLTKTIDHSDAGLDGHARAYFDRLDDVRADLPVGYMSNYMGLDWETEEFSSAPFCNEHLNVPSAVTAAGWIQCPLNLDPNVTPRSQFQNNCLCISTYDPDGSKPLAFDNEAIRWQAEIAKRLYATAQSRGVDPTSLDIGNYQMPQRRNWNASGAIPSYAQQATAMRTQLFDKYYSMLMPSAYWTYDVGPDTLAEFIDWDIQNLTGIRDAFGTTYKIVPIIWARSANPSHANGVVPAGWMEAKLNAMLDWGVDGVQIWRSSSDDDVSGGAFFSQRYEEVVDVVLARGTFVKPE